MADGETLGFLDEIQFLVYDKRQVVTYKWLSRNFSVSSNDAKRLLQEFVEKNGCGPKTVYTLSGRLKNNPQVYHIRLVSGLRLAVKQEFEDNFSVQVYSVQDNIPKDPAALWSDEFVQAEELFNQPPTAENCLRDNRFCGVSNTFVKRIANGEPGGVAPPQPNIGGIAVSSKANVVHEVPTAPQPQQGRVQEPSPKLGLQPSTAVTRDNKSGSNAPDVCAQASKDKEKVTTAPADKKKGQNDRNSSGAGGSLANLWGRASAKSKHSPAETSDDVPNPVITADAQICAREALDNISSDDDGQAINCKRESNGESNRKRRVVFDYSDDEDDCEKVVSLASPDPPKSQPILESKCNVKNMVLEKKELNFEEKKGDKLEIKQEKRTEIDSGLRLKEDSEAASKSKNGGISFSEKIQTHASEGINDKKKDTETSAASTSPKRRKVLKTRIDERGREVTEVVWEGEATDSSNADKNAVANSAENRPPAANKAPASVNTAPSNAVAKAGNKKMAKGGGKDAKQGNILSFFKKV
ncbi:uncharacterized protein LOC131240959 isoform X1 [Magnolia sinica]|uniref:uncharacterized protein LOC131240959 isoform X1 n=1 Tax=Magnolia sinica TaxID=86752 RepID=UPI0026580629|nr:uncharacterized protein LOC131240959 isoform X1 [Magnolia sinica]